jgi:hypothetical protein
MVRFRPRTGDFIINGDVFDIYTIKSNKKKAIKAKKMLKKRYGRVRILKRSGEYNVVVDSLSKLKKVM